MYDCKCPAKINVVILLLLILLNINNIQVVLSTIHKKTTNKIENSMEQDDKTYYTAAVVEFYPRGSFSSSPTNNVKQSMIAIEEYVARASNIDNADIIIFPEAVLWTYGLISLPNSSTTPRDLIQSYGESLPPVESIPCNDNTRPQDGTFSISKHISCMSIKYKITIVINTIDIRKCNRTAGDINCPLDGRYQYNTDVVFDGQNGGKIAAIYHKYHLFGTYPILNYPLKPEVVSFNSSFGVTFGIFICFDITFMHPIQNLLNQGIQHFLFSTWWYNSEPIFTATMFQQAFSRKFKSVLLAANTGASYLNSGSGIYENGNVLKSHYNSSTFNQDTYMVANISKNIQVDDDEDVNRIINNNNNSIGKIDNNVDILQETTTMNNMIPCQYDSTSLIKSGYCIPFLDDDDDDDDGNNKNKLNDNNDINYKMTLPNTNFTCSIEGMFLNKKYRNNNNNNNNNHGTYVLFGSKGLYTYKNRHVGGKNITLLVETCAVFHCNNNKQLLATSDNERKYNNLVCKANFNATQSFSKIILKGTFTKNAIQYNMIGFDNNAELLDQASDIITKDGSMRWETTHTKYDVNNNNVMHTNNNYDSTYRKPLQTKNLFSALIRGILQM